MENEHKSKSGFSKIINIAFILLISLGLFLIIYKNKNNLHEYKETLLHVNYWTLLFVLIMTIAANIFRSWRWYYLLIPIKNKLSFLKIFRVTVNALAANFTMPGKLGVPVKAVLLKKEENIEMGKSLPSILGEIFVEHSSEVSIAVVSVLIGGHLSKLYYTADKIVNNQSVMNNILIGVGVLALFIVAGVIFKKKIKSVDFFHKFVETIHITRKRVDCLTYSYLITIFNLIVSYYVFWLVVATLGHPEVELTFVIFAGTITNVIGLISPLPGGVGVREITIYGLYDFYFGLGGIAFLAIIIMRLITYLSLFLSFLLERMISRYFSVKKNESNLVVDTQ